MRPDEADIGKLVIDAARAEGVEHFICHSALHPQVEKMNHHWQKMRVEETIFESRLPFTILQPAPYMQNLLAGWKSIVDEGVLRVPYSVNAQFSFIDLEDVAAAASTVLSEPAHTYATYELAGTFPLSHAGVAEILGLTLNRQVRAEREEIEAWRLRAGRMSAYAVENLVKMFEYYDRWGLTGNPNVLTWLLQRKPASLESFIRGTAKEWNAVH
jgi:NAD(P)H dehydrogenase (quinone)